MEEIKINEELNEDELLDYAIEFIYYNANSVKNEPDILEMKVRIENGDVEFNIIKEMRRLRDETNKFPQYPPLGELHWLLVNYILGNLKD